MGNAIEKNLIFAAPVSSGQSSFLIWDEQPRSTPGGGVLRPFLWIPSGEDGALTIIHFHANAEDLLLIEEHLQRLSADLRANILGVEYPGYGPLQGATAAARGLATPTTEGIDAAASHALQYIVLAQGIPPSQVLLHGRSLGCGPALRLGRRARDLFRWGICGILLQSPFISVKQLAIDYVGRAGSMLVPDCYDNLGELQQLCGTSPAENCPVSRWIPMLFLHGKQDTIVQPYHSEALHKAARAHGHPAVEMHLSESATHDCWDLHHDVVSPILEFIRRHPGPKARDPKMMGSDLSCTNVMCSIDSKRDRERMPQKNCMAPFPSTVSSPRPARQSLIQGF
mmetsp:Transcript_71319/g.212726  ORF Transcript_71319/g.212726 Transcript_71319/m.212726 type:complete len:340 (-) Transcript_71319:83-1102(-)